MVDARRLLFGGCEPRSREDFQDALVRLCEPFADADEFARQLDATSHPAAHYPPRVARLELMSRLLWGLAPLAAGGAADRFRGWAWIREEIARGTDPDDPGYWGAPTDRDQRIVESAALGFSLALAADEVWQPLSARQKANFARWLRRAATAEAVDNNWRLFAIIVNVGLAGVADYAAANAGICADGGVTAGAGAGADAGVTTDAAPGAEAGVTDPDFDLTEAAFRRVDDFYVGSGWYSDGPSGTPFDYYGPWGIHFYGLINAARGSLKPETEAWVRERARMFAREFVHWFAADGAALTFGRSLTYRFAQSAYFGALAYADEPGDGLTWGQLRGLWARNMRWWGRQPVLNGDGTLSIGYAYPSLLMSESYNAPGSPYWAFKAFLPLALPADHPFWAADEEPLPALPTLRVFEESAQLGLRDRNAGHVTMLAAGPISTWTRHGEAKYGKFAYSTAFGFSVPSRAADLEGAGGDSMLLLSDDGTHWRAREENVGADAGAAMSADRVRATWRPWPDVTVETTLIAVGDDGRTHIREHKIETTRELWTAEAGFCVPLSGAESEADSEPTSGTESGTESEPAHGAVEHGAYAASEDPAVGCGILDLTGTRTGEVLKPDPNTHLLWPRTLLPTLCGKLAPGTHRLVTQVRVSHRADGGEGGSSDGSDSGSKNSYAQALASVDEHANVEGSAG